MADFIVSDDSDAPSKKRKRPSKPQPARKRSQTLSPASRQAMEQLADEDDDIDDIMEEGDPSTSTAQKWLYDPDTVDPVKIRAPRTSKASTSKPKAHTRDPEDRYPWLANMADINRNRPGHPDYDPSTVYVPPMAFQQFSAFEKQYWEIKQKLWDTVVFFKKGKFYELYENDATIGHQLFDLKLTDRVNMRMVGVPESSLDMWVNQFIAKGYKVARVDQMETALGKEMRERDVSKAKKQEKIIRRELACILTGGTLVDGGMLQDDMATFCVAIKESVVDDHPAFGITFVDAATGQFFLSEFEDDVDLTKFETFVAQTNPRELILEKSRISTKALRILKNNTAPTTIWNYFRAGSEFWDAELTRRELGCNGYFASEDGENAEGEEDWPETLAKAKDKPLLMSALGALVQYLRVLKIERILLSQRNFSWYSPIHKNGTLILDGQTLINLEVFSNTVNGGSDGTLFSLLNRCVTPFGKRLFRQWVCHPLCDIQKLNERLDAVDLLNADRTMREQFASQLTKMPDLERLISRVHAGACRPEDFVKVLEGFEQIEYTMTLLGAFGGGSGLIDRLVASMPDLKEPLSFWKSAFNRRKAREEKTLIPERGIEEDFDNSHDQIVEIKDDLQKLLDSKKVELKNKTLKFTDIGKEVYQIEAPKTLKVPKDWRQMSATSSVKRYYFGELSDLIRQLQEAEETHSQLVKEVAARLFKRFDVDYDTWQRAIRVVSQLDCLVSLARSSSSLGEPSCRPVFVDEERSVMEFGELRHPCMLNTVDDFIPNDVVLGGDSARINLLTGANAAGKSTILRMVSIGKRKEQETPTELCYVSSSLSHTSNICSSPVLLSLWRRLAATYPPSRPASHPATASCRASAPMTTYSQRRVPSSSSSPRRRKSCRRRRRARSSSWTSSGAARRATTASLSRRRCFTTSRATLAASASSRRTITRWRPSLRITRRSGRAGCVFASTRRRSGSRSSTGSRTVSPRAASACTARPCAGSAAALSSVPRWPRASGSTRAGSKRALSAPVRAATSPSAC